MSSETFGIPLRAKRAPSTTITISALRRPTNDPWCRIIAIFLLIECTEIALKPSLKSTKCTDNGSDLPSVPARKKATTAELARFDQAHEVIIGVVPFLEMSGTEMSHRLAS